MNLRLRFCIFFILLAYCKTAYAQEYFYVDYPSPGTICAGSSIGIRYLVSSPSRKAFRVSFILNDVNMVKREIALPPNLSGGFTNVIIPEDVPSGTYTISLWVGLSSNSTTSQIYSPPGPSFVVNALPATPVIGNVAYCRGADAAPLDVTGTNLKWYANASGGTGSTNAPIVSTGNLGVTNFYVSQTINGCEGARGSGQATINPPPARPTLVRNLSYCQNSTPPALGSSVTSGTNLKWYTSNSGGTGSSIAPIISTLSAGSTTYYVSQTNFSSQTDGSGCESERAEITVTVLPTPDVALPASQAVIVGATTAAINVTGSIDGTSYLWSNNNTVTGLAPSGSSTSSIPSFTAAGIGTSTIIILPVAQGCLGTPVSLTINVSGNTPDLRPYSMVENPGFTNEQTTSNVSINIRNMKAGTVASAPVVVQISKPISQSELVLNAASAANWTLTLAASGTHYILTSNVDIPAGPTGYKIEGVLTLLPAAPVGRYNLNAFIPTGTAGEVVADSDNNDVTSVIFKN